MGKINKKYIQFGNSTNDVNSAVIPANRTATNYTASDSFIKGHLEGIDSALGTIPASSVGDINETSFSISNNQSSAANVTGFAFANANVRSFKALASVYINATSKLYEVYELTGLQRESGWLLNVSSMGDSSNIVFSITSAGQIQYISSNYSGFVSGIIKFRSETTSV